MVWGGSVGRLFAEQWFVFIFGFEDGAITCSFR